MIWNHTMKQEYRIYPHRRYKPIRWPREDVKAAIQNMFNELMNRPDRTGRMEEEIAYMKRVIMTHGMKMLE